MTSIIFSSSLKKNHRDELETLLFFNPQQFQVRAKIIESIEEYGSPRIVEDGELLRIKVGQFNDVQTLYAFNGCVKNTDLVGVMIFVRISFEMIIVLHIGIKDEYSIFGKHQNDMLVIRFIAQLRDIAKKIKGVRHIAVMYGKGAIRKIPL